MRSFDLIAFDLDGTVFGIPFRQEVSARVRRTFERAHEAGAVVAVATGRPNWMLGDQLPRAPWLDWRITANGSRVVPSRGDDAGLALPIPRDEALRLVRTLHGLGGALNLHTNAVSYVERRKTEYFAEEQRRAAEAGALPPEVMDEIGEPRQLNPIDAALRIGGMSVVESGLETLEADPALDLFKLDCTLPDPAAADEVGARLAQAGGLEVARLGPTELEISHEGVSKGAALGWLCRHLGIDESRAVAFGDSGNDLSMAGRAATFVAMGNASDEVKAAADEITDDVLHDGVATWIEARL